MKVAGFTPAGAAIYLASGSEEVLAADLAPLSLTTRVLDGTPYEHAVIAWSIPLLAAFDAEIVAAGLTPTTFAPRAPEA